MGWKALAKCCWNNAVIYDVQWVYCPTLTPIKGEIPGYILVCLLLFHLLLCCLLSSYVVELMLCSTVCVKSNNSLHLWFLYDDIPLFVQIWLWTEVSFGTVPFLSICHDQIWNNGIATGEKLVLSGSRLESVRNCVSLTNVFDWTMTVHACESS